MSALFCPTDATSGSGEPPQQRTAILQAMAALDTPPVQGFDRLAHLAAHACAAPIAIVSLIDGERIWFKSVHGIDDGVINGKRSLFCCETAKSDQVLEVADAQLDPRFGDKPMVANVLRLRYGAGAPIRFQDVAIGTICVFDSVPHRGSAASLRALEDLALIATAMLRARIEAFHRAPATR